jgi:uncharacterized protein YjaG (DUF416 family)
MAVNGKQVMIVFDQQLLKDRLRLLGCVRQSLFALTCAERLFPSYDLYQEVTGRGDSNRLRCALDCLWKTVLQSETSTSLDELNKLDEYELLAPGEDTPWNSLNPVAENAVAAVIYAYRCRLENSVENAVWAAVQGYEATDYVAHTVNQIEFSTPGAAAAILKEELVQNEIARQVRDVTALELSGDDPAELARLSRQLRERAVSEGRSRIPALQQLS